jgi:hypothetical protein
MPDNKDGVNTFFTTPHIAVNLLLQKAEYLLDSYSD